jgi:ATP-binding cassette subfamily F protein 3
MLLRVTNIHKDYGTEQVLQKISFVVEKGFKVALVGFNGTGKTTLLKIITGEVEADKGKVEFNKDVTVGFLPQDPDAYNKQNVFEFLQAYTGASGELFERNVEIMFAGLALPSDIKDKKIGDLSSGQKTKVFLTGLLLKKVDLMLLDEPTNNLDLPALIWLEYFLQNTKSAFMVVSHDQTFLDHVANKIYEIDWKKRTLAVSNGKYSDFLLRKQKERKRQLLDHELQKEDIGRLKVVVRDKQEKAIKGSKYQGTDNDHMLRGFRRDRAGNSFKDSRIINNRIKRIELIDKPDERKDFVIEIKPEDNGSSSDIFISDLVCGYNTGFRLGPVNMEIPFGSRVAVLGLNGSGKSTFLKTITGTLPPISGNINIGSGVKFGNLMQEHETLGKDDTVLGFLKNKVDLEPEILANHLIHFGFTEEQFKTKIGHLSPGGRARLLLASFSATNVNTLVLDEPTNHLDMEAQEALEKTLQKFEGTVLLVTHDRFFVEKIDSSVLYVLSEGAFNKISNFTEYVADMEQRSKKLLRLLKF